jgi:hypothetical protein
MSDTNSTSKTLTYSQNTESDALDVIDGHYPFVRYGDTKNGEFRQYPRLRSIYEPIPSEAEFASPIYFLTDRQKERHDERVTRGSEYAVAESANIAREIQSECEDEGRVLYPVYVESDAREDGVSPEEMKRWIADFIAESLPVSPDKCQFYFSGNRSIHAHAPLFIQSKQKLMEVKQLATDFNEANDEVLDTGIYSRKRQFRLRGVEHRKTGDEKIPIGFNDTDEEIASAIANSDVTKPDTYFDFLSGLFGNSPFITDNVLSVSSESSSESNTETTKTPIQEYNGPPSDPTRWDRYWRHNTDKPVSPYANADADDVRSVTIAQVIEDVFQHGNFHYAPCEVVGMIGGGGDYEVFPDLKNRATVPRPVKISGHDIDKWDFNAGDYVVIITGKSNRSKMLDVKESEASIAGTLLRESGRQRAIEFLETKGYDVGSTGMNGSYRTVKLTNPSEASQRKREIEQTSVDDVANEELAVVRVACHLLRVEGWDVTWEWFKREYKKVNRFDPEYTYQKLTDIINCYRDDYRHVDVPDSPPA